jgi:exosortase
MSVDSISNPRAAAAARVTAAAGWIPGVVFVAALAIYIPTFLSLYAGPWQTEQEGHGPLIMAASAWLAWQRRRELAWIAPRPQYALGWTALLVGLLIMAVARSQDLLVIEAASSLFVLVGLVLLAFGFAGLRLLAFPIAYLFFAVPPPGWALDALTVPLKNFVSDVVANALYYLDYPIAQNGVMIMIGPYQLLVKDACSGMNSIFALSAIGVFYICEFVNKINVRAIALMLLIIPISVFANVLRVAALVLIAYYFRIDAVEGIFHDLTGILLFIIAIGLFLLVDALIFGSTKLYRFARLRFAA